MQSKGERQAFRALPVLMVFWGLACLAGAWPQAVTTTPTPSPPLVPDATPAGLAGSTPSPAASGDLYSGWVPVKGPHLSQSEFFGTQAMLESGLAQFQIRAMDDLADLLSEGRSDGNDPNLIHLIEQVNLDPYTVIRADGSPSPFLDPEVRIQGVKLLGLAGGSAAADTLLAILEVETEPAVLAEAWEIWRFLMPDRGTKPGILMARQLKDPFPNGPNITLMRTIIQTARESQARLHNMRVGILLESLMRLSKDSRYGKKCTQEADSLIRYLLDLP